MGRLFAGTPWDRPPACDRCGKPESDCTCPPVVVEPVRIPPQEQTARLRVEKRPRNKVVTVIAGLDSSGNQLDDLASRLKTRCGTGGTLRDGAIELQGDHLATARDWLAGLGYRIKNC